MTAARRDERTARAAPLARSIVVVAYGRADLVAGALAGLDRSEHVVVVDNSRSASVADVARHHGAAYLDPDHNRGFAGGVNVALAHLDNAVQRVGDLRAADVLLLNPDTSISSAQIDVLQRVLTSAGNEDVAAVSPSLVGPDGRDQQVRWPWPSPRAMWREAVGLGAGSRVAPPSQGFLVGAVLLLRRQALADVGPFDERYFLYAEEADWQRRAVQRGWRSIVLDGVVVTHVGGASSSDERIRSARFHAGQETFIRKWFGPAGWHGYRLAALLGATGRSAVLPGTRRIAARERATLYRRGPRRVAPLAPAGRSLAITHLVVTSNFAGTERHVAQLASAQAGAGHDVQVLGGDPTLMPAAVGAGVRWAAAARPGSAMLALARAGPRDVVHTHLTQADFVGALCGPWHGARLVSTRHIAAPRGSSTLARALAAVLQCRIDAEIAVSSFVARSVGRSTTVVRNGVLGDERTVTPGARRIVVAQRLETEKATEVALQGWALSGLALTGWTLCVAGAGTRADELRSLPAAAGVQWLGWVDDLRPVLLDCGALLACAPAEPFGLAVVEAMSVGLPVLAAAGGGHRETVGSVEGAFLFPAADVGGCALALRRFATLDASVRAQYGASLQDAQRERFTLRRQVEDIEKTYRNVNLS